MNFFKGLKNNDRDSDYDEDYYGKNDAKDDDAGFETPAQEAPSREPERPAAPARRAAFGAAEPASYSMKLMKPSSYEDGPMIANELLANNAVIINLENASAETAANLIFFLDGVTYAISGHLKPVSANTFMLTPKNMDITEAGTESAPQQTEEQPAQNGAGYGGFGGFSGGYGYRS
jgi:cell division inhibitor SepF